MQEKGTPKFKQNLKNLKFGYSWFLVVYKKVISFI
jgi:hypothetical protein